MTDPLDDLKQMMDDATPAPDPTRRTQTLRAAQQEFSRENSTAAQGSQTDARHTPDRPKRRGLMTGVRTMLASFSTRGALTATTALAALGLFAILPVLQEGPPQVLQGSGVPAPVELTLEPEVSADAPEPMIVDDLAASAGALVRAAPQAKLAARESYLAGGLTKAAPLAAPSPTFQSAPDPARVHEADTEAFPDATPNPLKVTAEDPVSTFSIDVDTASYAVVRSSLMNGQLPPQGAVRVEEMINYFPYAYPAPTGNEAFKTTLGILDTPWNDGTQLVHIAVQGALPAVNERPPLNLVFLIDTSGSMAQQNKLPLLKQSFRLMLSQLRPEDEVAIVTYAGSAGQVLAPTKASERSTILAALDNLGAGGSTAGQQGLEQAYATAETMTQDGEVSRVLLATDGDFNVGLSDPEALKTFIADKRETGTYLSVLGFGRGNLDDATMQALAQNGNGTAAYIDTLQEAQKVLVDQLTGALFPIANDVKIQVEFNPAQIAEYRLIGYETRILNREDFNNDKVDAGDIGAGHSVTAIYEVTPTGSSARLTDDLRYGTQDANTSTEWGFFKLRYKTPGDTESQLIETPITPGLEATTDARFATAIAGFGQLLSSDTYTGDWNYDDAIALASGARGDDPFGYRAEAIRLMRLAQSLAK